MRRVVLFLAGSIVFYCCQKKDEQKPGAITYELTNFRIESEGGCKSDSAVCAHYEVSYPVFKGLDSAVVRTLMKRIDASVSMGNPDADGESMQTIGKSFIDDFSDFRKEMPDYNLGWYYEARVEVEVLTDTLLSLSVDEEFFTGGAHGGSGRYFININPHTGADFTLDNFLKENTDDALRSIGERLFRREQELADTASLEANMFEFPNNHFELSKNYGFTQEGIEFYYNSYEIAPYAMGPSEVLIPYDTLRSLIRQ